MPKSLLSLLPVGLAVDRVTVIPDRVVVAVRARAGTAVCPLCRRRSHRVHSRYARRLGDLPWQGRISQFDLLIRRFRCGASGCPRRIFAERLPKVALPRVRRTARLAEAQRRIALTAGGEAGARLASSLAMPISGDTLLRLIRASPSPEIPTPRVIGIDDWAWRRGQRYGTLVVDLERNRPIDVLPDREAETVAAWLKDHSGVEIVARDRAGAYADGVRSGAPKAVQVADRWHLLRNLGDALAGVLDQHHYDLRAAALASGTPTAPSEAAAKVVSTPAGEPPGFDQHALRRARFNEVMALYDQGWSMRRIAQALGVNRQTVRAWLRSGRLPTWSQSSRSRAVDAHVEHLQQRWHQGCHNAAGQTSSGAARTVAAWKMPSKRRAAWLAVADRDRISAIEQRFVDVLIASSPELSRIISLAREFSTMVRRQQADQLDRWLASVKGCALAGFANGLRRDLDAIRAALSLPWSTGPVEGQISHLKTVKRTMCGRAKFDLLRHRILEAA